MAKEKVIHYVKSGDSLFGAQEWYCKKAGKNERGSFDVHNVTCPKCQKCKDYRVAALAFKKEQEYKQVHVNNEKLDVELDWQEELVGAKVEGVMTQYHDNGHIVNRVVGLNLIKDKTKKFYWIDVKVEKDEQKDKK